MVIFLCYTRTSILFEKVQYLHVCPDPFMLSALGGGGGGGAGHETTYANCNVLLS